MHRYDIITIFPSMFDSWAQESILARAQKRKIIRVRAHNLRDFTSDAHRTVDDRPFGGGAGMVLKIEPIFRAVTALTKHKQKSRVVLLSAKGKPFTQVMAQKLVKLDRLIFICGRYEGVDERVARHIADEEISIGPYVLAGGELAAMVIIEAVTRLVPGVLGNKESLREESYALKRDDKQQTANSKRTGKNVKEKIPLKEYPQYTRPEIFSPRTSTHWKAPKVLLSGDHKKIAAWRIKHTA